MAIGDKITADAGYWRTIYNVSSATKNAGSICFTGTRVEIRKSSTSFSVACGVMRNTGSNSSPTWTLLLHSNNSNTLTRTYTAQPGQLPSFMFFVRSYGMFNGWADVRIRVREWFGTQGLPIYAYAPTHSVNMRIRESGSWHSGGTMSIEDAIQGHTYLNPMYRIVGQGETITWATRSACTH